MKKTNFERTRAEEKKQENKRARQLERNRATDIEINNFFDFFETKT